MMSTPGASCLAAAMPILLAWAGLPAQAAGFACAKAGTRLEHLVCNVPALSALDSTIAATYAATKARLDPTVGKQVLLSQRSWLQYSSTVCNRAAPAGDAATTACMTQHYKTRIEQLGHFEKIGPFVFLYLWRYAVRPFEPEPVEGYEPWNPSENNVDIDVVTYPQVAQPGTAEERALNAKLVGNTPGFDPEHMCNGLYETDHQVTYATRRLVSILEKTEESCYGAPHPYHYSATANMIVGRDIRDLRLDDLFGPGDAWVPKLGALAVDPDHPLPRKKEEFDSDLNSHWLFTSAGLEYSPTGDDFGCHVGCNRFYQVAWKDLKPLLAATAPVP